MVPAASVIFMGISAVLSIGLPIALFFFLRKKYSLKALPVFVGAAAFFVFAMVLESLLHQVVLRPAPDGQIALISTNPALYVLYGIFAAGIFEETARFLSFRLLRKRYGGVGTGLAYGIGHGGIEAVLLAGTAMVSNLMVSLMINAGDAGALLTPEQLAALTGAEPIQFLMGGVERVFAIVIHISLSLIVWTAVNRKKWWLYPAAIMLHALVNLAAGLYQAGVLGSVWLTECCVALGAAVTVVCAVLVCKNSKTERTAE